MEPAARWQMIQPCLHQPRWREPSLICAGQLGVIEQHREVVNDLARRVLTAGSEHEAILHRDLFLAAAVAAAATILGQLEPLYCDEQSGVWGTVAAGRRAGTHNSRL